MTREADEHPGQTPDDSGAVEQGCLVRVGSSTEARVLERAESVPTPPPTPSGQSPKDNDEIEIEISSPRLRMLKKRQYIALPDVSPPCLKEEEISRIIKRLEMDLEVALGKIKGKSHRRPSGESSLMIQMRMSGDAERGSTKVKLKPCIWFFCGSRWCRKIIEKDIKKLNWRLPCDLQIVDEGGPFAFLTASEDLGLDDREDSGFDGEDSNSDDLASLSSDGGYEYEESGLDDYQNYTSYCAADFDTTRFLEDGNDDGSIGGMTSSDPDSGSRCTSIITAPSVDAPEVAAPNEAATVQPSESFFDARTNVYNTIDRRYPHTIPQSLPCEFSMIGCDRVFDANGEGEWIEHIMSHLRDILPRKLRCWYCVKRTFATKSMIKGALKINFTIRMQHIRKHILLDTLPVSWARPDMFMLKHLLLHRFIDDKTFRRLATQNTVLTGPGYLPVHNSMPTSSPTGCDETDTSLKLSDNMFLDFHVQETNAGSSIGLTCRSTIRRHGTVISERFSRMGGVITLTRGSARTLYGVTSGHGLVCQILENTVTSASIELDESDVLTDASSQSSIYDQDSNSDVESKEQSNQVHTSQLAASHDEGEKWMNASHGLVATFLNWRADSMDSCLIPHEAPSMSENKVSGDLALIKIPTLYAGGLRNDFVDPAEHRADAAREGGRVQAVTKTGDDGKQVFVLLSKTRSVTGYLVEGTIHFSVRGRKIECVRIMISEELGLGSSGLWVVQDDVLHGMIIAITPMDGCALILPQRRMYSDIQELFPGATSVLLSPGVPEAVPQSGLQKAPIDQVNLEPRMRNRRGAWAVEQKKLESRMGTERVIWDRKGKGKAEEGPSYFDAWQQHPGSHRKKKTLAVEITTKASENRSRRAKVHRVDTTYSL